MDSIEENRQPVDMLKADSAATTPVSAPDVDRRYRKYRYMVMGSITIGYAFYYVCRLGLSVARKPLIDEGYFTADQIGIIGAGIFYGYAFGKFVNGFIADHVNAKRFFIIGLALSIACNLVMGFSSVLWLAILVWALNGWFQSYGAPSCQRSIISWFSLHERGRSFGIWSASHPIGEGITYLATAAVVSYFGWRAGFFGAAISASVVCLLLCYCMKPFPQSLGLPNIADWKNDHGDIRTDANENVLSSQLSIFRMPAVWVASVACAFMYVARYAVSSWGILFLQEIKGFSLMQAGVLLSANTLINVIGGICYGFISDKVFNARRPPVNLIFGIFQVIALTVAFVLPVTNYWLLMAAFGLFGFSMGGLMIGIAIIAVDVVPKSAVAAAMGFVGIFSYVAAAMQETISGFLIDRNSSLVDGVLVYDFSKPVLFWIVAATLSVLLAASLWNVKARD